ncbi:hypothetical protein QQ045_027354 [Rhodiola kirilowii]
MENVKTRNREIVFITPDMSIIQEEKIQLEPAVSCRKVENQSTKSSLLSPSVKLRSIYWGVYGKRGYVHVDSEAEVAVTGGVFGAGGFGGRWASANPRNVINGSAVLWFE